MKKRWFLYALAVFAIALVTLFPLRLALDMTLGRDALLSSRQVAGSIWSGRIGDVMVGEERLGTFDVGLRPLPLLIGRTEVDVERLSDPDGPLTGRFFLSGPSEGVASLDGRVNIGGLVSPLPIDAVRFEDVDALFDGGACKSAAGTVTAIPATAIAFLAGELSGPVSCAPDGRVLALLSRPRGGEEVELYLDANGNVEAYLTIAGAPPAIGELLATYGFERSDAGWTLSSRGRLD
ncbi:type II secretion system protein N [Sphingomicrobium aestuariivivum]|uniref:type II secretion system protein N n=1 Tax=Sphingomicrobium aestuariivivum TaxID=1582356 RepID=UPI001FD72219|nr:type II secretion system protein N [Sphingomicrobium aestuariivivum]MCJ8191263.1 type II secretion system protein N [Sphingomicrobium aestuariivivum]